MAKRRPGSESRSNAKPGAPAPQSLPRASFFSASRYPFGRSLYLDDSEEFPTRDVVRATALIEMVNHCPEVAAALEVLCAYTLSSGTGDELGFTVVEDPLFPQPQTVQVARSLLARVGSLHLWWQVVWRMLAWGDAFGLVDVDTARMQISSVRLLPSWQVHIVPNETDATPQFYEQRWGTTIATMTPLNLVHWSYNRRHLYGRSLFSEALNDWVKLKDADEDLAEGNRSSAVQPNIHLMPPGADESYKQAYKADHEMRRKAGIIPDIYLLQGADVKKPAGPPGGFPLNQMIGNHNLRRARIVMRSRVPPYLLGIETQYAREIATQPAIAFVVFVGTVRQWFSEGLRQLIHTELALQQIPKDRWAFQLQFPKINVNPWQEAIETDLDAPGVADVQDGAGMLNRVNHEPPNGHVSASDRNG